MSPSRVLFAFSCLSLGALLVRCGGDSATCDDCSGEPLSGLTVITPAKVAVGSCAPAQIVQLDGGVTSRPTTELRLALEGDTGWYADAGCSVQATRATAMVGSRGAIAYVKADSSGTRRARARLSGPLGGETTYEAKALAGTATNIAIGGARYVDTTSCAPVWVAAADSAGNPANLSTDVAVNLAAPGTAFFTDSNCATSTTVATIGPARESAIVFAQFGLPGDITVTAGGANLIVGSTSVNVEGDQQLRVAFTPAGESIDLTAGVCTPVGIAVVDLAGAPASVGTMDVTLQAINAQVYSDASCATETTSTTIRGTSATTVYVRSTLAGSATLNATLANSQSRTVALNVTAGPAAALALSGSSRMTQGGCYRYVVQRVDAFDNLATGAAGTAALSSASLGIFSDAACGTAITSVSFSAESSAVVIYVRSATTVADATLSATFPGLAAGTTTVDVVGAPTAVAVSLAASATAGACSPARVTLTDAGGIPTDTLVADSIALNGTPASIVFFSDAACTTSVSSVVVNPFASAAQVWVRGRIARTYDLTFTSSTLPVTNKSLVIVPGAPATIHVSGSDRMNLGDCEGLELTLSDTFGNATTASGALEVELPTPARGTLHTSDACAATAAAVTFAAGSSTRIVFYKGTNLGADVVNAVSSGLTNGALTLEVVFFMGDARAEAGTIPLTRSAAIDPADDAVVYLHALDGTVWRSGDVGATWEQRCKTPAPDATSGVGFLVSPAADGTAYVNTASGSYRVEALEGAACPSITNGLSTLYSYAVVSGLTVDSTGRLFAWHGCCSDTNLSISDDYGATWTQLYDDVLSTAWMGWMANHPTNSQLKLVERTFAGTGAGLYRSTNGGSSWTFVTAEGFGNSQNAIKFDPAHPGYVYTNGRSSSTDGSTWAADANYNALSLSWTLDNSGAVYKFDTATTTSTGLLRAPDARTPVWAALEGAIAVPFNNNATRMSVSADGTTIAVVTGRDLYLTTNAGAEFARVSTPGTLSGFPMTYAAASALDGYAVGNDLWIALATHDGGVTWSGGAAGGSQDPPMIHVNPAFTGSVYVRGEEFNSTYDNYVMASQDGFATIRDNANGAAYSWAGVGAVSLADPLSFMTIGFGTCRRTIDGGQNYTQSSCPTVPNVWYPSPIGWLSPADNNIIWYAGNDLSTQALWQTSYADGSTTNLTARTGVAPAAVEMYGSNVMRVVSTNGQLVTSTDLAVSFGTPSSASTDGNCQQRYLTSVVGQPATVATACIGSGTVAVSRNAGATWTNVPVSGCSVRQIALFDAAMVVSCNNQAARTVVY